MTSQFRAPTDSEMALLRLLVSPAFRGSAALASQLDAIRVVPIDTDGSLRLQPAITRPADVRRRIPVEATYSDADGTIVFVLVHVLDGFLAELEIYREDSGVVIVPAAEVRDLQIAPWLDQ